MEYKYTDTASTMVVVSLTLGDVATLRKLFEVLGENEDARKACDVTSWQARKLADTMRKLQGEAAESLEYMIKSLRKTTEPSF